uniref:folate gamma-glutamyl hydrolase n=1 Tax=Neogobius melanostomus TaxID=47308 RepID=A0A8C6USS6_9GOBI
QMQTPVEITPLSVTVCGLRDSRNSILAQENHGNDPSPYGTSYIAASYGKYIESAGARVVPIRINRKEAEYEKLFNSINGLLLPGGDVDIQNSLFTRAAKIFYKLALKANDAGDYFPLWGTCQGLQQLTVLTANKYLSLSPQVFMTIVRDGSAQSSRLFKHFPKNLLKSLSQENITANFHHWSVSLQNFRVLLDVRGIPYSETQIYGKNIIYVENYYGYKK